ncbi:hypothetical protein DPMN_045955 [Dreissena polymorpha]|uniref:Uncharacterized protein n=1 Tax=Dreissena polymorpha TaxID=45954 RepID=A0A9D4D5Y5_DREPO|nr:hypothetical protein DPMN_045955 [Dreissena polymorpha]
MLRVHQFQVVCVTDRGDDTVHFTEQDPGSQSVWTIEFTYDTFVYDNVIIECLAWAFKLDLTSGTDNIFLPVPASKIRNSENVKFNVMFVAGFEVNTTVDVLSKTLRGNSQSVTNMTNATHIITLPYAWFNNNGLYPVNVAVSN